MISHRTPAILITLAVLTAAFGGPRNALAQGQTDRQRTKQAAASIHHDTSQKTRTLRRHIRKAPVESYSDTFLPAASATSEQFLGLVKGSRQAIKYYSKYLNVPPADVIASLSDGLMLTNLSSAGSFTEYRRHSNGVIYPVRVDLPRGTQVFKAMDGKVSLLATNGDPIVPYAMVVNIIRKPAPQLKKAPPVEVIITAPEREVVHDSAPGQPVDGAHP